MHLSKPGALAAMAALASASAAMAAATQVNVIDPTSNRPAHVEIGGRLAVQDVPPASYYHKASLGVGSGATCVQIAAPASGKALIVRQIKTNVFTDNSAVSFYANADCSLGGIVGNTTVPAVGHDTYTFDPGLAIPSGGVLSAHNSTTNPMNIFVDGYTVASGVAPAVGQTVAVDGSLRGQPR